ncbi:hypothetical protein J4H92_00845 [Leucobacter weissii]|uniref:Uncharacterized protein n=2 Tax=Leucobacter weissii TaxID=1983706 RepID=A0A939SAJ9_9MICO|nr:hypothetical protein [Leucobacter weissii]MBO1900493.1 hypothetical protein [Leucobacter weissii]
MGAGRWLFGIGGGLTWWYLPLIALPFGVLQLWTLHRIAVAIGRGRRAGRAPYVALTLSWACALAFGLTVPDRADAGLVTILSHLAGPEWLEMSIALCNPLGIIAFATSIAALAFAFAAGRDPRPSEDDLLDGTEPTMMDHPLQR